MRAPGLPSSSGQQQAPARCSLALGEGGRAAVHAVAPRRVRGVVVLFCSHPTSIIFPTLIQLLQPPIHAPLLPPLHCSQPHAAHIWYTCHQAWELLSATKPPCALAAADPCACPCTARHTHTFCFIAPVGWTSASLTTPANPPTCHAHKFIEVPWVCKASVSCYSPPLGSRPKSFSLISSHYKCWRYMASKSYMRLNREASQCCQHQGITTAGPRCLAVSCLLTPDVQLPVLKYKAPLSF